MTVLVILFNDLFPEQKEEFSKHEEGFVIITLLSTITSLSFYPGATYWEKQSRLQRENAQMSKGLF